MKLVLLLVALMFDRLFSADYNDETLQTINGD